MYLIVHGDSDIVFDGGKISAGGVGIAVEEEGFRIGTAKAPVVAKRSGSVNNFGVVGEHAVVNNVFHTNEKKRPKIRSDVAMFFSEACSSSTVFVPEGEKIDEIHIKGSAKVHVKSGAAIAPKVRLEVSGDGSIILDGVDFAAVGAYVSGSGSIEGRLGAAASNATFLVSGSGRIRGFRVSKKAVASVFGDGAVDVDVSAGATRATSAVGPGRITFNEY